MVRSLTGTRDNGRWADRWIPQDPGGVMNMNPQAIQPHTFQETAKYYV